MANVRLTLEGKQFGCLVVKEWDSSSYGSNDSYWVCSCSNCGKESTVRSTSIKQNPKSCKYCKMQYRVYKPRLVHCDICDKEFEQDGRKHHGTCSAECRAAKATASATERRRASLPGTLKQLTTQIKSRAKRFGMEFDLDYDYLHELMVAQNYRCAKTNEELVPSIGGSTRTVARHTLSVDRIDSSVGYVRGNVQLVTYHYNIAKNRFSEEELMELCKSTLINAGYTVSVGGVDRQ